MYDFRSVKCGQVRLGRRLVSFEEHILGDRDCWVGHWTLADIDEIDRRSFGMRDDLRAEIENFMEFGVASTKEDYG